MKRFVQFGGVLLALGMLLASCNIGMGDAQVSGDSVRSTSNVEGITLTIREIGNTGRTILPADWNDDTAEKLTYVLLAKEPTDTGYATLKTFSYSQLKNGTAVVNLDLVAWDLKLIGYITETSGSGADTTKACLAAELLNEDFSTGKKSVNFDLKPVLTNEDGSPTQATGDVDVTIAWLTTKPKRLEFGIYDLPAETDEIVEDEGRTSAKFSEIKTDASFAVEGTAHEYSFQQTNVPAGMYKFAAVFYNETTGGEVIGYYIDYLYVDGGNLSKETVDYGDKFNTIPENPSWLAVETVFVPQELTATTATVNKWYYAKFHWNDRSNNETGFELVITEKDGEDDIVVNSEEDEEGLISSDWYDGTTTTTFNTTTNPNTLDAGRTWVVLKLETGKLYTAKVRAINGFTPDYDASDAKFCKTFTRNGDGREAIYAPFVTEGTGDNAVSYFGMFTVNYNLNGGKVIKKKDSSTAADVTNYVVGYNYSSEEQDLMTDSTLVYPHVSKDGLLLAGWNSATKNGLQVIDATNITALDLTANWSGADVRVSVTFPSYANAKDVKIAAERNLDNTVVFDISQDPSISVTAGASLSDPSFVLTDPAGKVVSANNSATGGVWTWNNQTTKPIKAGYYCLQITGTYNDTQGSGRELTLCGNVYINVVN